MSSSDTHVVILLNTRENVRISSLAAVNASAEILRISVAEIPTAQKQELLEAIRQNTAVLRDYPEYWDDPDCRREAYWGPNPVPAVSQLAAREAARKRSLFSSPSPHDQDGNL